jgi:hypothetical protein
MPPIAKASNVWMKLQYFEQKQTLKKSARKFAFACKNVRWRVVAVTTRCFPRQRKRFKFGG